MAWITQNRNTQTVLLNQSYDYMFTKVGHEQGFAFSSADWVRSRDQLTCQQGDSCLISSLSTTNFHGRPLMTQRKCSNYNAMEGQRGTEGGCTRYACYF